MKNYREVPSCKSPINPYIPILSPFCKGGLRPALARLGGRMSLPYEAVMFDQPLSQRIKSRSGPGGIFLIQPGVIENLL